MEVLRDTSKSDLIQSIRAQSFGTLDDCMPRIGNVRLPAVIKSSYGSRSQGVKLAATHSRFMQVSRAVSRTFSLINIRRMLTGVFSGKGYKPISNNRKKFLAQEFIEGLSCDYKVVVYKDKYFFFRRQIKPGDFRASGTLDFTFPLVPPTGLLDYAEKVFRLFDVPFASFDIAIKEGMFHLLEFQFISFGQRALERSEVYFTKQNGNWCSVRCDSDLEENFVESIVWYISKLRRGERNA